MLVIVVFTGSVTAPATVEQHSTTRRAIPPYSAMREGRGG